MNHTALVSVITPAFNSQNTIQETLDSLLAQTYSHWECLVVIDQGTTDQTAQIVRDAQKKDQRIQLLEISHAKGLSLSRNTALKKASGDWIAFLDSDDLWLPKKLELQLEWTKKTDSDFSCTAYRRISADGSQTGHLITVPPIITYKDQLANNWVGCLTALVNRKKTGPFEMEERFHEDFLLWLDLLKRNLKCTGLNQDLARYRLSPQARSRNKIKMAKARWEILRSREGFGFFESTQYLAQYALHSVIKHRQL